MRHDTRFGHGVYISGTKIFNFRTGERETHTSFKMVRTPCCDKSGMKKGTWTPEEDRKLIAYVTKYGCWNWRQLPKFAGNIYT